MRHQNNGKDFPYERAYFLLLSIHFFNSSFDRTITAFLADFVTEIFVDPKDAL